MNEVKLPVTEVPLLDLLAQFSTISDEIRAAVDSVLVSQQFIMGPEVTKFEEEIASYCQVKHAIGVSSGSDALIVTLMAMGIGPGDEVITSPYTFFATGGAIARLGATPVYIDIDRHTYNMDPTLLKPTINSKTKAIIPVHLFGQCADMDPINEIASEQGIPVIEDSAQAIGARYKGRAAGSLGRAGCFSFFPSKNLGAYGDGGLVTTDDDQLAEQIRVLRVHGSRPKYFHKVVGGNFRLDAIQAAILRVKLKYLDGWSDARASNVQKYAEKIRLAEIGEDELELPSVIEDRHVFHQFVIRTKVRDALQAHLSAKKIGTQVYFPLPLHIQECFSELGYSEGDLPQSETAARETLALPVYPEMTDAQIQYVVDALRSFFVNQTT